MFEFSFPDEQVEAKSHTIKPATEIFVEPQSISVIAEELKFSSMVLYRREASDIACSIATLDKVTPSNVAIEQKSDLIANQYEGTVL